jgi:multicomponent K+:H+ antiporter subunit D
MMDHWISVPVLLPGMMAGLMVLAMRGDLWLQRVFAVAATMGLLAVAVALLWAATVAPPEAYHMGNWPAPFGIVLVLDRLSAMMVLLVAGLALAVLLYVIGTGWDGRGRHFHALFQFQLMGLGGAFLTGDAFNLFVFFEVLLIASYGLMVHGAGGDRLRAGVQYVAFNLIASTLFLFALGLTYAVTGTLNMADIAVKVAALPEGDVALMRVAAVLMVLVFAVKAALVPLAFWLPGTYANAPGPVAALFAIMTKVGAYAIIRATTLMFPPLSPVGGMFYDLMIPAALLTLAVGAIGVVGAATLPRLAAFSGIASMGVLFLAVGAYAPQAMGAALYYLIHSTLAGALLFLVADLVTARRGTGELVSRQAPIPQGGLIAGLFMAAAIASAGMPPLSGFVAKLLVLDALRDGAAVLWPAILVASFLLILGLARAGSILFWKAHESGEGTGEHPAEPLAFVAVGLLLAAIAGLTVLAGPVTGWLQVTADGLFAPAPYIAANMLGVQP